MTIEMFQGRLRLDLQDIVQAMCDEIRNDPEFDLKKIHRFVADVNLQCVNAWLERGAEREQLKAERINNMTRIERERLGYE